MTNSVSTAALVVIAILSSPDRLVERVQTRQRVSNDNCSGAPFLRVARLADVAVPKADVKVAVWTKLEVAAVVLAAGLIVLVVLAIAARKLALDRPQDARTGEKEG